MHNTDSIGFGSCFTVPLIEIDAHFLWSAQARKYIFDSLGADFLENNVLDLEAMLDEAENRIPLICLLSTGSDPTSQIEALARLRVQVHCCGSASSELDPYGLMRNLFLYVELGFKLYKMILYTK